MADASEVFQSTSPQDGVIPTGSISHLNDQTSTLAETERQRAPALAALTDPHYFLALLPPSSSSLRSELQAVRLVVRAPSCLGPVEPRLVAFSRPPGTAVMTERVAASATWPTLTGAPTTHNAALSRVLLERRRPAETTVTPESLSDVTTPLFTAFCRSFAYNDRRVGVYAAIVCGV